MNEVIELRSLHHQAYCLMLLIQTKTQARVMVENKVGKNGGGVGRVGTLSPFVRWKRTVGGTLFLSLLVLVMQHRKIIVVNTHHSDRQQGQ